jgi:uncharacterized membrane protein HdeD (DUF308 family)
VTGAEPKGRGLYLAAAILAIGTGMVAIIVPAVASVGMAILLGWILIFASIVLLVDAFSVVTFARTAFRVLLALATFAAGLYLLVSPLHGTYTLTVILVIWFVAIGFTRIVIGIAEHGAPGWGFVVLNGALSLALGLLIAERLPESADWAIGLLVGVDFLFYGTTLLVAWYALGHRPPSPAAPAAARPA